MAELAWLTLPLRSSLCEVCFLKTCHLSGPFILCKNRGKPVRRAPSQAFLSDRGICLLTHEKERVVDVTSVRVQASWRTGWMHWAGTDSFHCLWALDAESHEMPVI